MNVQIHLTRDGISPDLRKKVSRMTHPAFALQAAGLQIVSLAKRAFRDPSLRQQPWPAKKDGEPSNLIDKGMLVSSIHIITCDDKSVTVGSDRKYAAIHQLGGVIKAKNGKALVFTIGGRKVFAKSVTMPARPYLPFTPDGKLAPFAHVKVVAVIKTAVDKALSGTA